MEAIGLIDKTLATLKDFQRETVKSVIASFRSEGNQRVLVADEVGLGKTIVAKGVIAELLKERLQQPGGDKRAAPFRVTYICSNLTLADENRKKLAIFHGDDHEKYVLEPTYSRLLHTAVLAHSAETKGKLLEICSLTPSTSFNLTQGHGNRRERLIIFAALITGNEELYQHRTKLSNFFSAGVNGWKESKDLFLQEQLLDPAIVRAFHALLKIRISEAEQQHCGIDLHRPTWLGTLQAFCRGELRFTKTENRFRAHLRSLMAQACAKSLSADLFILDEFQRFKTLLDTDEANDESLIAREIFSKKQTNALLLSATPFKAVSRSEDDEEGEGHAEELQYLLNFLTSSNTELLQNYEAHRAALQQQILKLRAVNFDLNSIDSQHKLAIEQRLAPYLCRTERAQISVGYENLFADNKSDDSERIKDFSRKEIDVFRVLDQLGLALQKDHPNRSGAQLMEFYKAAPWPLSFLSGYQFKKDLDSYRQSPNVRKALKQSDAAWLSRNDINSYRVTLDTAPQSKIRALVRRLFQIASEELLWVPPSLPHYPLQGCYQHQAAFSKTLLFSSWAMVPRALSGMISYEAERRLLANRKGVKKQYFKDAKHSGKIRFDAKSSMVGWSLAYPSKVLCEMALPPWSSSLSELLTQRIAILRKKLSALRVLEAGPRSGDRWYALAPMLLDLHSGQRDHVHAWLETQSTSISRRNEHKGIAAQFGLLCDHVFDEGLALGPMPDDLAEYLTYLSIAGPAVSVARAWQRLWPEEGSDIAAAATDVAFAAIAMFNKPEAENIVEKRYPKQPKYFHAIAQYCAEGDFQAVIEEYGHLLRDAGFSMAAGDASATRRMTEVLAIRTSQVACQFSEYKFKASDAARVEADQENSRHSLRCHYAVPLGNQKLADETALQRVGTVRDSFNSPFRPFVLNSTSIGQEGLDFHWYCNQIVHWNLPANAIDIEQREGRINRYKSLVVRRCLAEMYRAECPLDGADPWQQLFAHADRKTKEAGRSSDVVPYWYLPEGSSKIERFTPMMPLSKDVAKLAHALKVLALYRLAFGQPRQEELLDNLIKREFSAEEIKKINEKLVINLSPLKHAKAGAV